MKILGFVLLLASAMPALSQKKVLVLQSDFGLKDGAVAAMKGVAVSVSPDLRIFDLTHEIPAYNIWEAGYRLNQTAKFWPEGTVFVSIVDPGVGSSRTSVVMKSKSGHYFVTPDNGTLTLVAESLKIEEVRVIDEMKNRLSNSYDSYTFHGRDVYAYTGARLAAGAISFKEVGPLLKEKLVLLPYSPAESKNGRISGTIDILDPQYGNVWTNIPGTMIEKSGVAYGDTVEIRILNKEKEIYSGSVRFDKTFSAVPEGQPIAYLNSLLTFSIALNMGDFANAYDVSAGPDWRIEVKPKAKAE